MKNNKVFGLLGFAAKSRNLVTGYNTCIYTMNKNKIKLVILASDLADNSKEKMVRACQGMEVTYRIYSDMESLSKVTGKVSSGIFGITDEGFAKAILKEIDLNQSEKEAK